MNWEKWRSWSKDEIEHGGKLLMSKIKEAIEFEKTLPDSRRYEATKAIMKAFELRQQLIEKWKTL